MEDVLATAFEPLREMEREMAALAEQMGEGTDPALLARYDKLTAAFEAAGGYETDTKTNKVCNGLTIPQSMREQLFDKLSGGEKTRVNLARLILEDTDILLLDEPTNHLDLRATEWLEEYLDKFKGTVLTVSHDRYFLDKVVNRIVEIQGGKAEFYSGNYSFYVVEKERRYEEKLRQYEKEQAKIEQLEKAAEQMRVWAYSSAWVPPSGRRICPRSSTSTTRSGTWWTPSSTSRTAPPRPPGTGWRPSSSGGRTCSSPCPPCPAESRAACGCACSWTRRSTC